MGLTRGTARHLTRDRMFAQCTNCDSIFRVTHAQLGAYHGLVRCGHCREVFNAAWNLVDDVPQETERAGGGPGHAAPSPRAADTGSARSDDSPGRPSIPSDDSPGVWLARAARNLSRQGPLPARAGDAKPRVVIPRESTVPASRPHRDYAGRNRTAEHKWPREPESATRSPAASTDRTHFASNADDTGQTRIGGGITEPAPLPDTDTAADIAPAAPDPDRHETEPTTDQETCPPPSGQLELGLSTPEEFRDRVWFKDPELPRFRFVPMQDDAPPGADDEIERSGDHTGAGTGQSERYEPADDESVHTAGAPGESIWWGDDEVVESEDPRRTVAEDIRRPDVESSDASLLAAATAQTRSVEAEEPAESAPADRPVNGERQASGGLAEAEKSSSRDQAQNDEPWIPDEHRISGAGENVEPLPSGEFTHTPAWQTSVFGPEEPAAAFPDSLIDDATSGAERHETARDANGAPRQIDQDPAATAPATAMESSTVDAEAPPEIQPTEPVEPETESFAGEAGTPDSRSAASTFDGREFPQVAGDDVTVGAVGPRPPGHQDELTAEKRTEALTPATVSPRHEEPWHETMTAKGTATDTSSGEHRRGVRRREPRLDKQVMDDVVARNESRRETARQEMMREEAEEELMDVDDVNWVVIYGPNPLRTALWTIGCIALVALLAVQVRFLHFDVLAGIPALRPYLQQFCSVAECAVPLPRSPRLIELAQTRVALHPDQPGALRVSAKLTNRADYDQSFPNLQLTLTDKAGRIVGRRVYDPTLYLGQEGSALKLGSGATQAIVLDLAQPHDTAIGFELAIAR